MDKPTIDIGITPDTSNTFYDMYLDKLLNWADDGPIKMHDFGYVETKQGIKMIERRGNVIIVKFD